MSPQIHVKISQIQAENLLPMDRNGTSDPYINVTEVLKMKHLTFLTINLVFRVETFFIKHMSSKTL